MSENAYSDSGNSPPTAVTAPIYGKLFHTSATSVMLAAIDSAAQNGKSVARRRFQKGSVFLNKTKTLWLGMYAEYVLDSHGVERRKRNQVVLCPVKMGDKIMHKREAQRLLQPYLDRVNSSLAAPARERKSATFEGFAEMWERDYLSLSKPSTQSSTRSYLKRLKAAFGKKDMRQIEAGDIQRLISESMSELDPKTIRNMWGSCEPDLECCSGTEIR